MRLGIAETLQIISEGKTLMDKVKLLKKYESEPLKDVLKLTYDQQYVWAFPKGWMPDYTPNPYFDQHGAFYRELRRIGRFIIPGTHPNLPLEKRMKLFVATLESISPDDAVMLCAIKDKRLHVKGVYRKIVNEAWPGMLPPARLKDGTEENEDEQV